MSFTRAAPSMATVTDSEISVLDGVTPGTAAASKALILGTDANVNALAIADGGLALGSGAGTAVTATAAELNKLDNASANVTATNLNTLTGAGDADALHTHATKQTKKTISTITDDSAPAVWVDNYYNKAGANTCTLPAGSVGDEIALSLGALATSLTITAPASTSIGTSSAAGTLVFGVAEEAGWANVTLRKITTTHWNIIAKEGTLYAT